MKELFKTIYSYDEVEPISLDEVKGGNNDKKCCNNNSACNVNAGSDDED